MKIYWEWLMEQVKKAEDVPGIIAIPLSEFDIDDLMRLASVAREKVEMIERILKTCWCFIILGLIWQGLELLIYHQIQPRVVDDIMSLLFLPFIYKALS